MGEEWCVKALNVRYCNDFNEILESFFSKEMGDVREILQQVQWNVSLNNNSGQFLRIYRLVRGSEVKLTGEMSAVNGSTIPFMR